MKARTFLPWWEVVGLCALMAGCTGIIGETPAGGGASGPGGSGGPGGTGSGSTGGPGSTGGGPGPAGGTTTGGGPGACEMSAGVSSRIWRLNDKQYKNAASDLVPSVAVTAINTPGRDPNEFVSWEEQFPIQEAFAAQLSDAAYKTAELAARNLTTAGNAVVTCRAGQAERDCAQTFVDTFATRAFRRPLEADERTRLMGVYDVGVMNGTGFGSGIELVISAVLQAPSFLYRTELGSGGTQGSKVALTPYELAAALSFLLLNSIPDQALWQTAVSGTLSDPAVLGQQVDRLLTLPKVQENLTNLTLSWVGAPNVLNIEKTTADLGGKTFDEPVRQSMFGEAQRFVSDVLWKGGSIADLFQSRRAFVDQLTAGFYGVTYSGQATSQVELPANRAGLLTRAGVVASIRYGTNPEVFRGVLLRMHVLCGDIPPPPANVDIDGFNAQYGGLSTQARIDARSAQASCKGCHQFMDPLGIAYDNLGGIGQVVTTVNGVAANPAGQLTGTDVDGAFADVVELSQRLARSQTAKECIAEQLLTYAVGRELASPGAVACASREVAKVVDDSAGQASALFRGIAQNPVFTTRVVGGP